MAAVNKRSVIESMERLGVWKIEFEKTVERYVALSKEYAALYSDYAKNGYKCTVDTVTGVKKSPEVVVLENLRKDLLALESALGLTPAGLLKLNDRAFEKPKKAVKNGLI